MRKAKTVTLDEAGLKELTDDKTFHRGKAYFQDGRVVNLSAVAGGFRANVHGNRSYVVKVNTDKFDYACSCPVGRDGWFCKHLVAACMAWGVQPKPTTDPYAVVRDWLLKQDIAWLAETLLEQSYDDNRLFNKLHLLATQSSGGSDLRAAIDRATEVRGFVEFDEAGDFAGSVHDVIDALGQAVESDPKHVAELCLHAMNRVKEAIGYVDDSSGELGQCMARIQEIHLAACKASKPEPRALARQLLQLELDSEYGEFHNTLETYSAVLGKKGIEEYKRAARKEWDKLPPRETPPSPGRDPMMRDLLQWRRKRDELKDSPHRYALTRIMTGIARRARDTDGLIAVLSKDLTHARAYADLVEVCRERKRYNEALEWARKGVEAFKHESHTGLDSLLAEELKRSGDHTQAVEVAWRLFTGSPSMEDFNHLLVYAKPLKAQEHWRDKAVGHLRKTMSKQQEWPAMETRTLLVEIFLGERNIKMALQEADSGRCRWETLTKLAEGCQMERPREALKVYYRLVSEILKSAINAHSTPHHRSKQAVDLMGQAQDLSKKLDSDAEFKQWHDSIYGQYKHKRTFRKLLDQAKLV